MNKTLRNMVATLVLSCALLLAAAPCTALATPLPDASRTGSLSVSVACGGEPLAGVAFRAWRVAGFDAQGRYELAGAFAGASVSLGSLDKASDWDAAAQTLLSWAGEKGVEPDAMAASDAAGKATLAGLEPGLYLLAANEVQLDGHIYTPATYLESVPRITDDGLVYDVASACKVARTDAPATPAAPVTPVTPGADASNSDQGNGNGGKTWAQRMGLVQTGDNSITLRGVLVLVALGAVLVAVGLILWPRRHHKDDDSADEKR